MNEKVLIESEKYNLKKLCKIFIIVGLLLSVMSGIIMLCQEKSYRNKLREYYEDYYDSYYEIYLKGYISGEKFISSYPNKTDYVNSVIKDKHKFESLDIFIWVICPIFLFTLIGIVLYLWLNSYKLTVTDKKVYGTITLGKRVDLPMDSISSVSFTKILRGCGISTSSGKIHFFAMKNCKDIFEILSQCLIERQDKKVIEQKSSLSSADELLKYKKLFDEGIITQEEFEQKKIDILK